MANGITLPSPPNTPAVAASILAYMAAQSGVVTDYNKGSQIRTLSQAVGSVVEIQGVESQALAFQAAVYGAFAAFNITPFGAVGATGTATFATSLGANPPAATQNVTIAQNTIVQTTGGIQFVTTTQAVLLAGQTSVSVPIVATSTGLIGNVAAGAITQLVSSIVYPLQVTNVAPTSGGENAESPISVLNRFTSAVLAIGLGTPVAIANGVIGVTDPSGNERVKFATVYEPWTANISAGAGYQVYIDSGAGSASSNLISAVETFMNGVPNTNNVGDRPAGVPYTVNAVNPLYVELAVSGTITNQSLIGTATTYAQNAINQFFSTVLFNTPVYASTLNALVSNAIGSILTQLTVSLVYNGAPVTVVTPDVTQRVILQSVNIVLS